MKIKAAVFFVALGVAACGNQAQDGMTPALKQMALSWGKGHSGKNGAHAKDAPAQVTQELVDHLITPAMAVTIEKFGLTGLVVHLRDNNGVENWASFDDVILGLRQGIVVSTAGWGADLMAVEVPSLAMMQTAAGGHERVHVMLDGEDQLQRYRYSCQMDSQGMRNITIFRKTYATQLVEEICHGDRGQFTNSYWITATGQVRKSRQWVSPEVGYIGLEDLRR